MGKALHLIGQAKDEEEEVVGLYVVANPLWTLEKLPRHQVQRSMLSAIGSLLMLMGVSRSPAL